MPASRLLRVETEAADDGRPAYERVARDVLEDLFGLAMALDEEWEAEPDDFEDAVTKLVANSDHIDRDLVDEARELAAVERTIGGDPDE